MITPAKSQSRLEREVDSPRFALKSFIMAVSFANLSVLNVWTDMVDRRFWFYRRYGVSWEQLIGLTLFVLLLAVLIWIPVFLVARSGNTTWIRALKWCFFAGLALPLNIIRQSSDADALS